MHHQAAQKAAELFQHVTIMLVDVAIVEDIVIIRARGGDAVIDAVEANGDADHYRHNGQRIEEGGEEGRCETKRERQQHLTANPQQQAGKDKQQQLLHKIDPRHHEHQQQEHFQIAGNLFTDMFRAGHADHHRLNRQQASRQERITLECHGEGKDKFHHQHPAGNKRIEVKNQRVNDQNNDESEFIPVRGLAKKIAPQSAAIRHFHDRLPSRQINDIILRVTIYKITS